MPEKQRPTREPSGQRASGIGVDAHGGPVIDPTENVIALTDAANRRQDDLRDLNDRRLEANINFMREMMALRAEHQREMLTQEASRLNSIRQVDQANVQTAADRQLAAIQTLAAQTATNAETLRSALTSTASAIAVQTANTVSLINERIGALEKAAYTGEGKQTVVDPQMDRLAHMVEKLATTQTEMGGRSQGMDSTWKMVVAAIGLMVALNTLGVFEKYKGGPQPYIYTPAPAGTVLPSNPPVSNPR